MKKGRECKLNQNIFPNYRLLTEEGVLKSHTPFCNMDFLLDLHFYVKDKLYLLQNRCFLLGSYSVVFLKVMRGKCLLELVVLIDQVNGK